MPTFPYSQSCAAVPFESKNSLFEGTLLKTQAAKKKVNNKVLSRMNVKREVKQQAIPREKLTKTREIIYILISVSSHSKTHWFTKFGFWWCP